MTGERVTEPRPRCHCCGAEIGWEVQHTWGMHPDGPMFGGLVAWIWEHRPTNQQERNHEKA